MSQIDPPASFDAGAFGSLPDETDSYVPVPDLVVDALVPNVPSDVALRGEFHRLARLAFVLCGDAAKADDAAAEALARVWQRAQRGDIKQLRPYLRRTLVNVLSRQHRRHSSEQRALSGSAPPADVDAERLDETVAIRTDMRRALQSLPADQRAVIALRYFEGLTEDEIAHTLRVRPGTVKSRASRGLATLRAALEGDDRV